MTFRGFAVTGCLAAAMALPAVSLAAGKKAVDEPATHAKALLKEFHTTAVDAKIAAGDLYSLLDDTSADWNSVAPYLYRLKESVNKMGQEYAALKEARDGASPSERKAIDDAGPLLQSMGWNTQRAIEFINAHELTTWLPEYHTYINNLANVSSRLTSELGQFDQFAKTQDREKRLENSLGLEAGSM
jgi:hypothetical protein